MLNLLQPLVLAGVTITLAPEARVRGAELALGDVARIEAADAEHASRLAAFPLGYAPAPGHSRLLNAERLLADLRRDLPGIEVRFSGAGACRVWPQTEVVPAAEIEQAARDALRARLADPAAEIELRERLADVEIPAGREPRTLRASLPAPEIRSGLLQVPVRVLVDGGVYRTLWTSWDVRRWEERAVLVRDVKAGDSIEASMLERRRVARPEGAPPLAADMAIGAAAVRDLAAGSVLQEGDLLRPTLVQRGDTVILAVKKGAVQVRVSATALQAGALGDKIRVAVQSGGRELTALVATRDQVQIVLSNPR